MINFIKKYIENLIFASFIRSKKLLDASGTAEVYAMRNDIQKLDLAISIWAINQKISNLQKGFIK